MSACSEAKPSKASRRTWWKHSVGIGWLGITVVIYDKGTGVYAGGFASAMSPAAIVCGFTALLGAWLLRELTKPSTHQIMHASRLLPVGFGGGRLFAATSSISGGQSILSRDERRWSPCGSRLQWSQRTWL